MILGKFVAISVLMLLYALFSIKNSNSKEFNKENDFSINTEITILLNL